MVKFLQLKSEAEGYDPSQCEDSFTIRELIETLEYYESMYGDSIKVYISNGYTFGGLNDSKIKMKQTLYKIEEKD